MNKITDPKYLSSDQYKDSSNLSKRASIHKLYGTNPADWQKWLMGKIILPENALILELGSGPGYLWVENQKTIPVGWKIVLTDISGGILEEARGILGGKNQFDHIIHDAQEIPFSKGIFDAVIANHMLYHVRDLNKAMTAVYRVLKNKGSFYTATNSKNHLVELRTLEKEYFQDKSGEDIFWAEKFSLENGKEILSNWFENITCFTYPNTLKVTDPEAIIAYLNSKSNQELDPGSVASMSTYLKKEIKRSGSFEVRSEGGLFVCQKI